MQKCGITVLVMPDGDVNTRGPVNEQHIVSRPAEEERFVRSRHLVLYAVDESVAIRAAELRARYELRTPDALQIATTLTHHCDAFLTNDAQLKQVDAVRVLVLDDLAEEVLGD